MDQNTQKRKFKPPRPVCCKCSKKANYSIGAYIPFRCSQVFYCEEHLPKFARVHLEARSRGDA